MVHDSVGERHQIIGSMSRRSHTDSNGIGGHGKRAGSWSISLVMTSDKIRPKVPHVRGCEAYQILMKHADHMTIIS